MEGVTRLQNAVVAFTDVKALTAARYFYEFGHRFAASLNGKSVELTPFAIMKVWLAEPFIVCHDQVHIPTKLFYIFMEAKMGWRCVGVVESLSAVPFKDRWRVIPYAITLCDNPYFQ